MRALLRPVLRASTAPAVTRQTGAFQAQRWASKKAEKAAAEASEGDLPDPQLGGKTLHELQDELHSVQTRLTQLQSAVRFFKDTKKKRILFLGAGRSSGHALRYLLSNAEKGNWYVKLGDHSLETANHTLAEAAKASGSSAGLAFQFDVTDVNQRRAEIAEADIVISLLPATMHDDVAEECVSMKKDFLNASYTSPKVKALDAKAKENGVLVLTEMGLDPGIDHMSCMKLVHSILEAGGEISSLETNTGGLVAPESDNNPWNYKFSWAPRNVILAGQGGCKFIDHGEFKYIPYHKLFTRTELIDVPGAGVLEAYANRDSLSYRAKYQLHTVPTLFRGTFRKPGYASAWNILVQLGATSAEEQHRIPNSEHLTYRQWINSYMRYRKSDSVELKLAYYMGISIDSPEMQKLKWLGLFENKQIGIPNALPADILQHLLERKWKMMPEDKDMIVMWNRILYNDHRGRPMELISSMVDKGVNREDTAMAKTVGLPLAIGAHHILSNRYGTLTGVCMPTLPAIYNPVLDELEKFGVKFVENNRDLPHEQYSA